MKKFGEKLRSLRKRHRLTMRQLGKMLDVDHSYVGRMERGEKTPNAAMIIKIARLFKVTTDQLMMDELELD